jgi:MFS family permease
MGRWPRSLRALLAAEVISTTGSQMTWLALPWFVLVTTGSAKQMSFVIGAEAAGYAIFGIPSGTFLTRLGSRTTMRLCDALRAPLMLLVPILYWTGALSLAALLPLTFALGAVGSPYGAAQRTIVPELLGEDEALVARTSALFQGATRVTMLTGPAVAGVLIGLVGAAAVLVIDAASFLVAFLLVTVLVPRTPSPGDRQGGEGAGGVLEGVRFVLRDPLLRAWTLAIVVGDAAWQVVFVGVPVLVVAHFDADPRLAGALLASWGVGAVAGNVAAYRIARANGLRVAAVGVLVQAAPLWVVPLPVPAILVAVAFAVSGIANGVANPTLHAMLTLRPPAAVRAKVVTAIFTGSSLGAPAALALAGPAFSGLGVRHVLAIAAAAQSLAMLAAATATLRHVRNEAAVTA